MKNIKDLKLEEMMELIKGMSREEQLNFYYQRMVAQNIEWNKMIKDEPNDYMRIYSDNDIIADKIGVTKQEFIKIQDEANKVS